jgi:hypothetical protein
MKLQFEPPVLGVPRHLPVWCALLATNNLSLSNLGSNSHSSSHANYKTKQSYARFFLAPVLVPEAFFITPTPLNLHKCLPPGAASFKQLYRTRPAQLLEPTCPLTLGRIRYNTSVSGQLPSSRQLA